MTPAGKKERRENAQHNGASRGSLGLLAHLTKVGFSDFDERPGWDVG